jgi:hypothetical protein
MHKKNDLTPDSNSINDGQMKNEYPVTARKNQTIAI